MKMINYENRLRRRIQAAFRASGLTQNELAERVGWKQPEISFLMSPDSDRRFSVYRLAEIAPLLGLNVEMTVTETGRKR